MSLDASMSPAAERQLYSNGGVTVTNLRVITKDGTYLAREIAAVDISKGALPVVGALRTMAVLAAIGWYTASVAANDRWIVVGVFVAALSAVGAFTEMKSVVRVYLAGGRAEVFSASKRSDAEGVRDAILSAVRPS